MPYNPRTNRPRKRSSYHPEALAWRTAALTLNPAGQITTGTMTAVSNLCTAVDAAGLRDRFVRLNLFAGDNVEAAVTPLYRATSPTGNPKGGAYEANYGPYATQTGSLSAPGYYPLEGFYSTSSNSDKYLSTGLTIADLAAVGMSYTNCHMSAWWGSDSGDGAGFGGWDGNGDFGGQGLLLDLRNLNIGATFSAAGYPWDYNMASAGTPTLPGFYVGTLFAEANSSYGFYNTTQNCGRIMFNGTSLSVSSSRYYTPSWDSNSLTPIFANAEWTNPWNDGGPGEAYPFTPRVCMRAYSIGQSLSQNQANTWYSILGDFFTAIGRTH
jgi:hypothetical protein